MRIISGVNKGMKLVSPPDESVRPTIDRIKEAAFNIMQFSVENSRFLDMFSGSGQMGIEACARGAEEVWMFDPSASSMKVIRANVEKAGFADKCILKQSSYTSLLAGANKPVFDLAYIDPPFGEDLFEAALEFLFGNGFIAPGGTVIVETPKGKKLPEAYGRFKAKVKNYGQIALTVYRADEEEL